jgi:cobalamin biosynthesis Mg chelatase CobN
LLDYFKEKRGYWKLKEETLDRILEELASEEAMDVS